MMNILYRTVKVLFGCNSNLIRRRWGRKNYKEG